jgi:hypothetical protein
MYKNHLTEQLLVVEIDVSSLIKLFQYDGGLSEALIVCASSENRISLKRPVEILTEEKIR